MLRHEMVHALHQRIAPVSNSLASRQHAESLATRAERKANTLAFTDFLKPVPTVLAFPPQTYSPWSKVWIGNAELVGEVVESGITVRIIIDYGELGLKTSPKYHAYHCGMHDMSPLPDIVKKMKKAAQTAAEMNKQIPTTATTQRVALILIYGDRSASGYRVADGKGLIVLSREEFDANQIESTITHEGSHAIFEFHSVTGSTKPADRVPDAFALRIADLYVSLSATKLVPEPKAKFDKKSPPSLTSTGTDDHAAGLVMVMDTLWSGSGGHPWHGVDEFFASAYAAYLQQRTLLGEIISFYEKYDPSIKPLAKELLDLLAAVADPKKWGALKAPKSAEAARAKLDISGAPPEFTKDHPVAGRLIDPSMLRSPDAINCSIKGTTDEDMEKILDIEVEPKQGPAKPPTTQPEKKPDKK